jgi:GT2 family glycosyltransferase
VLSSTVVICCYTEDRWDDVVAGLRSLEAQDRRPDQVVVVVDHNEALRRRVEEFAPEVELHVDVVANGGGRGLSGARNTGVAAATGEVVVFLDDDAAACGPEWVSSMLSHYDAPDVWGVGGAAEPDWHGDPPAWFPDEFGWVIGCSYTGQPTQVASVRNLLGCNMSFRRDAFDEVGGFTEGMGRVGTKPVGCEETEFCIRLRQVHPEARLLYDPEVRVTHRVSPDRHRFGYFRSRCLAEGRSKAQVTHSVGQGDALASERAYVRSVLPAGVLRGVRGAVRGDGGAARRAAAIVVGLVWTSVGYLAGRLRR